MSTVKEAVKKRSSTRGYTTQPLTQAELEALVEAGLQAPTAANRQEIYFTVVKGDDPILAEIETTRLGGNPAPAHNFYYEAPTVIILSGDRNMRWSFHDAGIAVQNIALVAEELGLGSVIIGCIYDALRGEKREYFEKALKFPENYEFQVAVAVGHKAVEKEPHTYDAATHVSYI